MIPKLSSSLLFFSFCCLTGTSRGSSKHILVTGGAGFIGFHTALRLAEDRQNTIVVLDTFDGSYDVGLKKARAGVLKGKGVMVHSGDVCSDQVLDSLFEKHSFKHVVHMAAKDGLFASMKNPNEFIKANTECLLVLLRVLTSHKSTHLVFASSYNIVDKNYNGLTPAISLYSALKAGGERLVAAYCQEHGISAVGVRPFSVYGPWGRPDGDIYRMAQEMDSGKSVEVYGSEDKSTIASRDYTYVDDVVDGVIAAMDYIPDQCGKVFNIGSGAEPISMDTVFSLLEQEMEKDAEKVVKSLPMYEPIKTQGDISEAKLALNYAPKVSIKQGIKEFVKWFHDYYKDKKWSSSNPDTSLVDSLEKDKVMYLNKKYKKRLVDARLEYEQKALAAGLPVTKYYHKEFKKYKGFEAGSRYHGYVKMASVSLLTDWCRLIDECVAFDTKGRLYSHIQEERYWKSSQSIDLYVADIDVCKAGLTTCYGNCTCTYKGPGQAANGCQEGFGLLKKASQQDFCYELYVPGKTNEKEKEFKVLDWVENRDWDSFIKDKPYVKFAKKYIDYGVVAYYPDAAGDVDKLKAACDDTYHCIGFTTNGELKGILNHIHRWKSSDYDLYVRDVDYCSMHEEKCRCKRMAPGNYACQGRKP